MQDIDLAFNEKLGSVYMLWLRVKFLFASIRVVFKVNVLFKCLMFVNSILSIAAGIRECLSKGTHQ